MYQHFLKPILPHLYAIIVFVAISVAYFSPEIFENKTILGHDSRQGTSQEITEYGAQTEKPFDKVAKYMPLYLYFCYTIR